jgi:hypothetical protein
MFAADQTHELECLLLLLLLLVRRAMAQRPLKVTASSVGTVSELSQHDTAKVNGAFLPSEHEMYNIIACVLTITL